MPTDPFALAADLLVRVVGYFDTAGINLPTTQYVAPGASNIIAYDEEAVMATVDWIAPGRPGDDQAGAVVWPMVTRYAQFSVTVLRDCATETDRGVPPAAAAIQTDAQVTIIDMINLAAALEDIRDRCQQPGGWVQPGTPVAMGRTVSVGPSGAMVAAVSSLQVTLL